MGLGAASEHMCAATIRLGRGKQLCFTFVEHVHAHTYVSLHLTAHHFHTFTSFAAAALCVAMPTRTCSMHHAIVLAGPF